MKIHRYTFTQTNTYILKTARQEHNNEDTQIYIHTDKRTYILKTARQEHNNEDTQIHILTQTHAHTF